MNIEAIKLPTAVLIKVTGRMDAAAAPEFQKTCETLVKDGALHQVVDLGGLQYISSAGLSHILVAARSVKAQGGSLALCGLHGMVKEIFTVTKFLTLFPVYESADEALQHI